MKKWLSLLLTLCLMLSMAPTALMESADPAGAIESFVEAPETEDVASEAVEAPAEEAEFQLGGGEDAPAEAVELPAPEAEQLLPADEEYEIMNKAADQGTPVVLQPNTPVVLEAVVGQTFTIKPSSEDVSLQSSYVPTAGIVTTDVDQGVAVMEAVGTGRVKFTLRGYDSSRNLFVYNLTVMVVESLDKLSLLAEGSTTLEIGDALTLYAVGASGTKLTWSSGDTAVARVSGTGTEATVTAAGSGRTDITAVDTASGKTATLEIIVNSVPASLKIVAPESGAKLVYASGEIPDTAELKVELRDADGNVISYNGFPFNVTSSSAKIIEASSGDSTVEALGIGKATITVTSRVNTKLKDSITLQVVSPADFYGPAVNSKTFPDANFLDYVQQNVRGTVYGETTYLDAESVAKVTELDVSDQGISSLKGVELFTALKTLRCGDNSLSTLDLSANTQLEVLECSGNKLSKLTVSQNPALTTLVCDGNNITALDLSANPGLSRLMTDGEKDTNEDDSGNPTSYIYSLDGDLLAMDAKVKVSGVSLGLEIGKTAFPDENFRAYVGRVIDTSRNGYLSSAECEKVTAIVLSESDGEIASVKGIENFPNLKTLNVSEQAGLSALDVSKNPALEALYCNDTAVSTLNLAANPALKVLHCYDTKLTRLDISKNPGLIAAMQDGAVEPVSGAAGAEVHSLDGNELAMDKALALTGVSLGLKLDAASFPDDAFRACLTSFDKNGNGYLTDAELAAVTGISVPNKGIASLSGIERFTNLAVLECDGNQLTALSLSANAKLECVTCAGNGLKSLDIGGLAALSLLDCSGNALTGPLTLGGSPLLAAAYQNAEPVKKDGHVTYEYDNARLTVDEALEVTTVSGPPTQIRVIAPAEGTGLYCNVSTGNTLTLTAELKTAKGEITTGALSWTSANTTVATVSDAGVVTAVAPGTARITAALKADPALSASLSVKVTDPTLPQSVEITAFPENKTLFYIPGANQTFQLAAAMSTGTDFDAVSGLKWSTSKADVLTVDAAGLVTAVGYVSAVITVTAERNSRAAASVTLQVVDTTVPVGVRIVNGDALKDHALIYGSDTGNSFELQAELVPAEGYTAESGLTWTSSAPAVVKVEKTGALTARITCVGSGDGSPVTITAAADRNAEATAAYQVTVVDYSRPEGIEITGAPADGQLLLAEGHDTVQLGYQLIAVSPEYTAVSEVNWTSSDQKIATVDKDGLVTARAMGEVEITAAARRNVSATATVKLTVIDPTAPTGIRITDASKPINDKLYLKLDDLKTVTLRAEMTTDREGVAGVSPVEWTSSNTDVATVDKRSGRVTARKVGKAVITATATRVEGVSDSYELAVSDAEPTVSVAVQGDPVDALLLVDGRRTMTLEAKLTFEGAELTGGRVSWESENKKIAAVNSDGLVTARSAGTCEIVATVDRKWVASYQVDVIDPTIPEGVRIANAGELKDGALFLGESFTLEAELLPNPLLEEYASLLSSKLTWSSSNKKIVSVDKKGTLTARKAGKAVITVFAERNPKKALATIGVKVIDPTLPTDIRLVTPFRSTLYLNVSGENTGEYRVELIGDYPDVKPVSGLKWTVQDKSVASVKYDRKKGVATVTAKKGGTTRVTVTAERNEKVTLSFDITVDATLPKVEIINAPALLLLKVEDARSFSPQVQLTMPTGEIVMADASRMEWKFSPSKAASYNKKTGEIAAREAAKAVTATVTYGKNRNITAQCSFDIVDPTAPKDLVVSGNPVVLTIDRQGRGFVKLSDLVTVVAEPGFEEFVNTSCTAKEKSSKVVSVKNGLITARGEGETTVTVTTVNKISRTITVRVEDHTTPSRITFQEGTSIQAKLSDKGMMLNCLVYDLDGNTVSGASIKWSTSDKSVAAVSGGKVSFRKAGTVTITAALKKNGSVTPAAITITIE